jgi:hypothetical protein
VRQSPGFAVTYARCPSCWHDYAPEATVWWRNARSAGKIKTIAGRLLRDFKRNVGLSGELLSFCGLKCTTFLHFKTYHPEEIFLFILMARFVERDLSVGSYFLWFW